MPSILHFLGWHSSAIFWGFKSLGLVGGVCDRGCECPYYNVSKFSAHTEIQLVPPMLENAGGKSLVLCRIRNIRNRSSTFPPSLAHSPGLPWTKLYTLNNASRRLHASNQASVSSKYSWIGMAQCHNTNERVPILNFGDWTISQERTGTIRSNYKHLIACPSSFRLLGRKLDFQLDLQHLTTLSLSFSPTCNWESVVLHIILSSSTFRATSVNDDKPRTASSPGIAVSVMRRSS